MAFQFRTENRFVLVGVRKSKWRQEIAGRDKGGRQTRCELLSRFERNPRNFRASPVLKCLGRGR
jgi:hypothetical protein